LSGIVDIEDVELVEQAAVAAGVEVDLVRTRGQRRVVQIAALVPDESLALTADLP